MNKFTDLLLGTSILVCVIMIAYIHYLAGRIDRIYTILTPSQDTTIIIDNPK